MKTFIKLLLLVLAVTALPSRAATVTVPIYQEGTNTNQYVPVDGYYYDTQGTKSQMIYPADVLGFLHDGDVIKGITFYTDGEGIKFGNLNGNNGKLTVTIGLTDATQLSSLATMPATVATATVVPTKGSTTLAITFSGDLLVYDGKSNLIVQTEVTTTGTCDNRNDRTKWLGTTQSTNTSYCNKEGANAQKFLPYMDLTYECTCLAVDKTSLDFGKVAVGTTSAPQTLTVTNMTDEDAIWYFRNSKFATTKTPATVPAGETVEIPVTFSPGYTAGTQTGELIFTNGDKTVKVALTGFGLAPLAATIDPQTVNFGDCSINKEYTATVTLTNIGSNAIKPIFTQPAAPSPFSVEDEEGELPEVGLLEGESRTYTVTFSPEALVSYTGKFTFTIKDVENENDDVSYEVNLQGKGVEMALVTNSPVHFGSLAVGNDPVTKQVTFSNPFSTAVTVDLSTEAPFSIAVNKLTIQPGQDATVDVTFAAPTATDAVGVSKTGTLTATGEKLLTNVVLVGAWTAEGPVAIRDEAFFENITYTWKEGGVGQEHTSNLAEIATDPDQIIAMLKEVYTNKSIPGNYKRGYASDYGDDHDDNVNYGAVGALKAASTTVSTAFDDAYGWGIKPESGDILKDGNYYYFNPNQFKPDDEGVTLLLLELVDDFKPTAITGAPRHEDYQTLRGIFESSIKSARVVTHAKRVGTPSDHSTGTLFKVDCDKMNKFFFMAKGQLAWMRQRYRANSYQNYTYYDFSYPFYNGSSWLDHGLNSAYLTNGEPAFLCHMFEQLSPADVNATSSFEDGYQMFVTDMKSFGVIHDCPNVPYVLGKGHHFMMYGDDSDAADCADIRDMMFLVPDYRMLEWTKRSGATENVNNRTQDYFQYNENHKPSIGVFVIHQETIEGQIVSDQIFRHHLKWKSNLDKFLPGDQQYFELWEVKVNEFGVQTYEKVYYRNADGNYTDAEGNEVSEANKVPIVLNRSQLGTNGFTQEVKTENGEQVTYLIYNNVYVDRTSSSQVKTYVIRGCDAGNFLSLQMSNQQEVFIPGTDPHEKARMIGATYYSRYNPKNEKNCYSNRLELDDNTITLTASDLSNPLKFYRSIRTVKMENGEIVHDNEGNVVYDEVKTLVATATANANGNRLTVVFDNQSQSPASEYPDGVTRGKAAGYHSNTITQFTISTQSGYVRFNPDFKLWDNFTVDVSENEHPVQYFYKMEVGSDYSNEVRIPVYKTDSRINNMVSLDEVIGDNQMNEAYSPGDVEFKAKVQMSAKSEILRYDAYRWSDKEIKALKNKNSQGVSIIDEVNGDDEGDIAPTGMAGNQGDWYTVSMNDVDGDYYYVAPASAQPQVSTGNPTAWANFIDYYPNDETTGTANEYLYAPVVELFTKGYKEDGTTARKDYNSYGGPQKIAATGRMELAPYEPDQGDSNTDMALMSRYKWYMDGNWYSYYNVYLNFSQLDLPNTLDPDYELYKVRAWRKVTGKIKKENGEYEELTGKKLLGEEVETRQGRAVDGWYMYEDINFGDDLDLRDANGDHIDGLMSKDELKKSYCLGHRSTEIPMPKNPKGYKNSEGVSEPGGGTVFDYDDTQNPNHNNQAVEELIKSENRATFGALRMKNNLDENGTLDELTVEFKVRAYFTKKTNPLIADPVGSTTTSRDGEVQQIVPGSNFDYYVTEARTTFTQKASDPIITGISSVIQDVNREVVNVTYVNPIGQMSSTPWQGVNIVVTRYSDGSTTTQKVIR